MGSCCYEESKVDGDAFDWSVGMILCGSSMVGTLPVTSSVTDIFD